MSRMSRGLVFLAVCLLCVPVLAAENDTVVITIIDVGHGDAVLVEYPPDADGNRARMLIDGGPDRGRGNAVMRLLRDKNITMLDVVLLTHPAERHYQGLIPVLEDFIVEEFWWSGEARGGSRGETAPESWIDFERAKERAQEKILLRQGDRRAFEQAKVKVLNAGREHPNTSRARDINNDSVVLMLGYKGTKVLFAGDIEEIEGQDMVDDYCGWFFCRKLNVDIVKAAHHGSGHYSSKFLRTVDAEYVILSAQFEERDFHHPRSNALQAYEEYGAIEIYSTGMDDITGNDNIVITIGPARNQFLIEGSASGFTYWRDMDDDNTCEREVDQGFCLEIWE